MEFAEEGKLTYVYIDNAARGVAPRHLLAYTDATDYAIKYYGWSKPASAYPNKDASDPLLSKWPAHKGELMKKNPFTLLPYMITEKGEVISSNSGIMTYLGLRYGFKTGVEAGQLDTQILAAIEKLQELRENWMIKCLTGGQKGNDELADQSARFGTPWPTLKFFDDIAAANKTSNCKFLFTNAKPSIADFSLFSTIFMMKKWHSKLMDNYPNLQAWCQVMMENEGLKKLVESEKDDAIFGDVENMAAFGLTGIVWGVPGKMDPLY